MTSLTIPQCLEKLAVLDSEFAVHDKQVDMFIVGGIEVGLSKSGRLVQIFPGSVKDAEWDIFGTVCELIRFKGWNWSVVYGTCNTYTFRIFKETNIKSLTDPYSAICEDGCIVTSALNALVQAMVGQPKECSECENLQHGIKDEYKCKACGGSGYENPILSESNISCPNCSGTGVESDPIKGTELAVNRHCPACNSTGKKLEVKG